MAFCWLLVFLSERISTNTDSHFELSLELREKITLVEGLVLNPDAHAGYGAPVGCVLVSPTHVYPGPVGVDIKCSMSFLQLDLPADLVADKTVRRALIDRKSVV